MEQEQNEAQMPRLKSGEIYHVVLARDVYGVFYLIQGPAEVEEYFKEVGYSIPVEDWGFDFRGVCGRALRDSDPGVYAVTVKYTYTPGDAFSERDPDVEFTPEAFVQIPLLPYLCALRRRRVWRLQPASTNLTRGNL